MRRLPVSDANDAVAEVFLAAWRRLDDVPADGAALPYLYGIARNKVFNAQRSAGRRARLERRAVAAAADSVPGPESVVMAKAESDAVDAALAALRPDDREIILLRSWEELTGPQIAEVLGISPAAAHKRLARALDRLASQLQRTEAKNRPRASQKGGER
jgi:RNA polymerase sigma-70 factor (ECF subfamily)